MDAYEKAESAAQFVLAKTKLRPSVGLVLGSGLGPFADDLSEATRIAFADMPGFPTASAEGHAGNLVIGKVGDLAVAALQGRAHFYEGHNMESVVFPMRVFARMGIKTVILTNAAGGVSEKLEQGCLVVLSDHINFQGTNPMIGANDARFGLRFFDMSAAYDPELRQLALREGLALGIKMHEGVYAAVTGPSYETPAEIRALRTLGTDVVGMSTVPEVIAARHMGLRVLAISCVTNLAAGISKTPLNHEEVLQTGRQVRGQFAALLRKVIAQL
jgi:purine-nucleoside phosphorylase